MKEVMLGVIGRAKVMICEVKAVGWSTWHGRSPKTRKGAGGDTLLTCLTCLLVRRAQQKFKPCHGNRKVTSSQMNMWCSLSDVNRRALLEVWDMSYDEAEIVFGGAAASWRSNPTLFGHDLVELVATRKLLTCRNCWSIRQAAGKLATCASRSKGPTKKQVAIWKGLKKHHGLQLRFAEIWGVSLDEAVAWYEHSPLRNAKRRAASASQLKRGLKRPAASKHRVHDSWKHDVCQDGDIHPNPGPSSWRVVSLNVGGMSGTWKAIDAFLSDKLVRMI